MSTDDELRKKVEETNTTLKTGFGGLFIILAIVFSAIACYFIFEMFSY